MTNFDLQSKDTLLIFDGNCQSQHISACFLSVSNILSCSIGEDLGFVPSFGFKRTHFITESAALELAKIFKSEGKSVYQISQLRRLAETPTFQYTPLVDRIINFPFLKFYACFTESMKSKFGLLVPASRVIDLNIDSIRVAQVKSNSKTNFAETILSCSKQQSLFHTAVHLGGYLTSLLFLEVANEIAELSDLEKQQIANALAVSEGMNQITDHPVRKDVLSQLGYDWGDEYQMYSSFLDAVKSGDWQRILSMRADVEARFPNNTQFIYGLGLAARETGDSAYFNECCECLTNLSPGHPPFWEFWLDGQYRTESWEKVDAIIEKARRFFDGQRLFYYILSFVEIRRGNLTLARECAETYQSMTPDKSDAIVPLLKVLILNGRPDQAMSLIENYIKSAPPHLIKQLSHHLWMLPELNLSKESYGEMAGIAV